MLLNQIEANNVTRAIAEMIISEYHVGDKIPTERELAKVMNVSRSSLRESLQTFKNMGVLQARQGSGIYVTDIPDYMNSPSFLFPLQKADMREMLDIREALELKAYALIPAEDFPVVSKKLKSELDRISSDPNRYDAKTFIKHDLAFHGILRRASKNQLLASICDDVSNVVYDERNLLFSEPSNVNRSLQGHFRIYEAFHAGDRDLAMERYKEHVALTRQYIDCTE